jgi:hypothetical protein
MRNAADRAAEVALRLPREVERDPRHAAVLRALAAGTRRLWSEGHVEVPVVPLTPELRAMLGTPVIRAAFVRGLEGAEATLAAEARGLAAAPGAVPEPRVSRLLLAANDGAERLYRQLERLVRIHAPRLLVCLVDAPSDELGGAIFGPDAAAKVALTTHKDAATRILLALAPSAVS